MEDARIVGRNKVRLVLDAGPGEINAIGLIGLNRVIPILREIGVSKAAAGAEQGAALPTCPLLFKKAGGAHELM